MVAFYADRVVLDPNQPSARGSSLVWSGDEVTVVNGDVEGTVRFQGCTILPGLVDCHVHLGIEGNADDPLHRKEADPILLLRMARNARVDLDSGVTSCRDLGTKNRLAIAMREALQKGLCSGPRVVPAGRPLGAPEGHCNYMTVDVRTADEARVAVRSEIGAGAECIKLMVTGGIVPPSADTQMSADTVFAATEEGHRLGVKVAAHSETVEGARLCARAGVDSIEHGGEIEDGVLETMARRGITFVPTLGAFYEIAEHGRDHGLSTETVARGRALWDSLAYTFRRAMQLGVRIAVGTDYRHGSISQELELMVRLGMTPQQAVSAATNVGAMLLEPYVPSASPASPVSADFIVVEGDPLVEITHLRRICAVIQRGRLSYPGVLASRAG